MSPRHLIFTSLLLLVRPLLCAADEPIEWQAFKAIECRFEVSPACLSMLEVSIKDKDIRKISLYAYKMGEKIKINSKGLEASIKPYLISRHQEGREDEPFISETVDFVIQDGSSKMFYLVSREIRVERLLIVPLINLGNVLLPSESGKLIEGNCDLMILTKSWIENQKSPDK